jgi:hypothetical protein
MNEPPTEKAQKACPGSCEAEKVSMPENVFSLSLALRQKKLRPYF